MYFFCSLCLGSPFDNTFALEHGFNYLRIKRNFTYHRNSRIGAPCKDLVSHVFIQIVFIDDYISRNIKCVCQFYDAFQIVKPGSRRFGYDNGFVNSREGRNNRTSCSRRSVDDQRLPSGFFGSFPGLFTHHVDKFSGIFFSRRQTSVNELPITIIPYIPITFIAGNHRYRLRWTNPRTEFAPITSCFGNSNTSIYISNGIEAAIIDAYFTLITRTVIDHCFVSR